jgi:branched-chain amino acid transport system substrate-binding protein
MDLEVVEADTGSEPSEADSLFRQHVEQDGAVAGVGPVSSDVGIRVRQTASDLEAPLLLHMAGSHRILPKNQEYTFRLGSHSAPTDMRSVVGLMEEQGYSKVGAIVADYEWGRSVETTIGQLIPDDIDLSMEVAPLGADDFTPIIRNLPNDIEFMIGSGHPPGAPTIHAQARELGYEHEFTVGAGIPPSVLSEALGDLASSFGHQHVSDPFSDQFASVGERYGEARDSMFSTHHAYGYASIDIFAQAIEAAGSTNRDDIVAAMVDTEFDTLLANPIDYVEYGEVQDLVHMLSTVESGAPEYYSNGSFQLSELYRSDPLPAFDPDNWDFSG